MCVCAPIVVPSHAKVHPSTQTETRPLASGRLNVVVQLPAPYDTPVMANNAEYVVLETAVPSHRSHPEGAELPA